MVTMAQSAANWRNTHTHVEDDEDTRDKTVLTIKCLHQVVDLTITN